MKIRVNNEEKEITDGCNVATLVSDAMGQTAGIAVAINDRIARRAAWEETALKEGDAVVIIKAAYGG